MRALTMAALGSEGRWSRNLPPSFWLLSFSPSDGNWTLGKERRKDTCSPNVPCIRTNQLNSQCSVRGLLRRLTQITADNKNAKSTVFHGILVQMVHKSCQKGLHARLVSRGVTYCFGPAPCTWFTKVQVSESSKIRAAEKWVEINWIGYKKGRAADIPKNSIQRRAERWGSVFRCWVVYCGC
jgi:hypothetical protein